ncbi:diguanylate cyclase (GGDEF)-like protein [Pseudomonas duriflava]|uniref:diguanylate cyclase n=1 Tax=Pseudomonas duriflava TaxID=459528 RepID=A0A562Q748_9PSED|nr:GGDEF domain-containing protein [Pseudomonas duriflava]TWI52534.1 diguanylate cyclase (GGDEF)-like protein [Pseudomonas duriflava]
MLSYWKFHRLKLLSIITCAHAGLLSYLLAGALKPLDEFVILDILGEGGSAMMAFIWICLILKSRPAGRVTTLLTAGLGCVFFSLWMDFLDEFMQLPEALHWDHWLESTPMPIGLLLLTIGLYHWHREQLGLNQQMRKRERLFREHLHFDTLTPLSSADYLKRQIELERKRYLETQQTFSLIVVDMNDFAVLNRVHGHAEGDRVLQAVSQLLIMNLRQHDLLCRLAGDRFVALLPNTGTFLAQTLAQELERAVRHFAYKSQSHGETLTLSITAAVCIAGDESAEQVLERLQSALAQAKQDTLRRAA